MELAVGICTQETIKSSTMADILNLISSGLVSNLSISTGSLLPQTRNAVIDTIYKTLPTFTHCLLIDSDMTNICPELIQELIKADKDVISACATQRRPPFKPCFTPLDSVQFLNQFSKPQEQREIVEVYGTGMACTLIKREVLEVVKEGEWWFFTDRRPRDTLKFEAKDLLEALLVKEWSEELIVEAFEKGLNLGLGATENTKPVGEDYNFCDRARRKNFHVFVHTGLYVRHIGEVCYGIDDFLDILQAEGKGEIRLEQKSYVWRKSS